MLNKSGYKWWVICTYAVVCLIQIISASQHQLFGDEAFYWLESQNLDWSYAELPGWTQWMIALSQWLLPQSEFAIRLPSLLAALSLPWIGMAISQAIQPQAQQAWRTGLLFLSLPLLTLAGILAIPDIWVIFFGTLAVYLLIQCLNKPSRILFVTLGLILAFGINVHVRFWLVIFIAAAVTIWQFRNQPSVIRKLLLITLPIMLLGFIPILLFNLQHDFPLFAFQLSDRHPWSFQPEHFKFFVIQFLVTTPLMFVFLFQTVRQYKALNKPQSLITSIAVSHWLLYAFLGFFSDELRFNWHWPLFSYVLIATVAGTTNFFPKLSFWAKSTGVLSSLSLMLWLYWGMHLSQSISTLNARFTENARGWKELASATEQHIKNKGLTQVVTDQFMTLAELKFYLSEDVSLSSLPHPLNQKHGRQKQLEIMRFVQPKTTKKSLLVVEHSTLKFEQTIPFYQHACEELNGIRLIGSLDYQQGIKFFYFFETGTGTCELPLISRT